jgi:lactate racemase
MPQIRLKYGRTVVPFDYDEGRFDVLGGDESSAPLTDVEIGERFDSPIGSEPLEETIAPGDSVLLVVPDATRQTGCGQIVNLLVRRLIASGVAPFDIAIIFATGIHRVVTDAEKELILTPFIVQRIKTINHGPRDLMQIVTVGQTSGGIPVELNRALTGYDHVVLIGGVNFHYFAGFTGGRKLICPGLASSKTISATHKLAFDCETGQRRSGVGTGLLDGNAVHEAFAEAASMIESVFCISAIVNEAGQVAELYCGDLIASHRVACEAFAATHTVRIPEKRGLVVASCGGWPHDINMIQTHKALEAAAGACSDGGTIILLAECADGLGRPDFIDWFEAADSRELAARLCEKYQVNGQTAWSLLRKTERFDVRVVSSLEKEPLSRMGLRKIEDSVEKAAETAMVSRGYLIPNAAKVLVAF